MTGRVLVTGASGFIGQPLVRSLVDSGWTVVAASRTRPEQDPGVADWIEIDLLAEDPRRLTAAARADVLVHIAWIATPGLYGHSLENLDWLRASAALSAAFLAQGGRRLVGAGTCLEYDRDAGAGSTGPRTIYAATKHACRLVFERQIAAIPGASLAWPRIFFLLGPRIIPTDSPRASRASSSRARRPRFRKGWSNATSSTCATAPARSPPWPARRRPATSTSRPARLAPIRSRRGDRRHGRPAGPVASQSSARSPGRPPPSSAIRAA